MAQRYETSTIQARRNNDPSTDINILLLGPTGIGKTTFINGLANYLCNDTLEDAARDQMQVVIPSSFSFTDDDTFEDKTIYIGESNEHEHFNENGNSCTQQCRSFLFPIGEKNLRIIDTPGIGDTRGFEQDTKNFHEILTYISQYEHLNGVCILLKPNEERLTILFRFCINELLRHLHTSASENIIFVFTNARSTFFKPGATSKILRTLLDQHRKERKIEVPFTNTNTFLLDNEAFRYLALRQHGIQLSQEQKLSYQNSWNHTVQQYSNLMAFIVTRSLHAVCNTLSLNEAEQLVRKLTRPIVETTRLIEENLQLAKKHAKDISKNPALAHKGLPQKTAKSEHLKYPTTICTNKKCCRTVIVNNETKIEPLSKCHEVCYLIGVIQESYNDERMANCEVMHYKTGICSKCGCVWNDHQHITYEVKTDIRYLNEASSAADITKRINNLKEEKAKIEEVYKKLAKFLHANAILPLHDDIVEYLKLCIKQEEMKTNSGGQNNEVIQGLELLMKEYKEEINLFKETIKNEKDPTNHKDVVKPDQIFTLVGTLYRLPIYGNFIRTQVNGLKITQDNTSSKREVYVELPSKANASQIMRQFKNHMSST
ncbi:unnamed protein product [Rotaria sp. Silwood1]|nr:unnamed protein product [Rotaria sp. Silwood1]CAF3451261.1 unnamed protein product [Rotaria sp. Silwood1]CAF3540305.1 unnamed protein product [Rotaria sp. Silwood1]CAF3643712.1 unnamed protein product [Rotaria sp. Silwood1]CAF4706890.1 unnamed protein product [Rotaria sp. Silwood1]